MIVQISMFILVLLRVSQSFSLNNIHGVMSKRHQSPESHIFQHRTNVEIDNKPATASVLNSAAIVAGTTIGGGFLALPSATAPAGMVPSVLALSASWCFLLCTSYSLVESIFAIKSNTKPAGTSKVDDEPVSVYRVANECFGAGASAVISCLFASLMMSTLVAQLSKVIGNTLLLFHI